MTYPRRRREVWLKALLNLRSPRRAYVAYLHHGPGLPAFLAQRHISDTMGLCSECRRLAREAKRAGELPTTSRAVPTSQLLVCEVLNLFSNPQQECSFGLPRVGERLPPALLNLLAASWRCVTVHGDSVNSETQLKENELGLPRVNAHTKADKPDPRVR